MTSREIVRAAINHRRPERIPCDFGGTKVTGIHADLYARLGKELGLDTELPKVYEQHQMLARPEGYLLHWLNTDVVQVENPIETWGYRNQNWKIWKTSLNNRVLVPGDFMCESDHEGNLYLFSDGNRIAKMAKEAIYFDRLMESNGGDLDLEIERADVKKYGKSIPLYTDEELRCIEKNAKFLYENTEYSLHGGFMRGKFGNSAGVAHHDFTEWMIVMLTEPEYAKELMYVCQEAALKNLKMYLQACGKYIDTILISTTDFGTQRGEMISPAVFREIYQTGYKAINDYIHANTDIKTMYHSCGSIRNIIPYFIEAGVDILNPVQTSAANMDLAKLKKEFGNDLVFWGGGMDTQNVLPNGTAEEIDAYVKDVMELMDGDGGFVFAAIHNLQPDVPFDNLCALIDAFKKYR